MMVHESARARERPRIGLRRMRTAAVRVRVSVGRQARSRVRGAWGTEGVGVEEGGDEQSHYKAHKYECQGYTHRGRLQRS